MIGNAHLDPAWMWTWGEGMEAFIATCRSALDRMTEHPDFVFTCSSAAHYRWVERSEPELFERIRERVREGRWNITGGWWVQADCNLPSGEGFARQALLGQRYFLDRFGRIAHEGYSPDAFGHNLGLPQILALSGMTGYVFCRPDPTELTLPAPLVRWRGPEGTPVLAYRVPFHYNMYESSVPKKVRDIQTAFADATELSAAPLSDHSPEWMLFYGVGNHGGGPTREHIAQIDAIGEQPGEPAMVFSTPERFFDRAASGRWSIPQWRDDLQLNAPGCYSACSQIKRLNRQSEYLLMAAERVATLAALLLDAPYPGTQLRDAWERVCFNHFHDILCGVAIREALDEAVEHYGVALATAREATRFAQQAIARAVDTSGPGQALLVFNSHAFDSAGPVTFELWHDIDKALWTQPVDIRMSDGENDVPCQVGFTSGKIGRDRVAISFRADVPALGWRSYRVFYGERSAASGEDIGRSHTVLENDLLRAEIGANGCVQRLYHKELARELLAAGGEALVIDDPTDTWGHGRMRFDARIGTFGDADIRLVENGPEYAVIRARSRFGSSWLQQDFRLDRGCDFLRVTARIFWCEQRMMMKLGFPVAAADAMAHAESAYCATAKPCDGIERPCGAWVALEGTDGAGLGVITDAKHAYSAEGHGSYAILMVTALRSPSIATHDPHPYDEREDLEFLDQGHQRFAYQLHALAPGWRSALTRAASVLNAPLVPHLESAHESLGLPATFRGIAVEPANVVVTVVKPGEDGTGTILRLFETEGIDTTARVGFCGRTRTFQVELRALEVTTLLLRDDDTIVRTNLIEMHSG